MSHRHHQMKWRDNWTTEPLSGVAVHLSCVAVRVSHVGAKKVQLVFDNIEDIDTSRWDMHKLTEQAMMLWLEHYF